MKTLIKSLMALATAAAISGSAYAIPTLVLFDGTTTLTIVDEAPGGPPGFIADGSFGTPGAVSFNGTIGIWSVSFDLGQTKPLTGSSTNVDMDLNFVATTNGTGTLSVKFSDSGFTQIGAAAGAFGGTAGAGMTVSNALYIDGVSVMNSGPFSGAFSNTNFAGVSLDPSNVVTLGISITSSGPGSGAGKTSSGDFNVTVPDGGTTALLVGLGLVGMSVAAARRKKA